MTEKLSYKLEINIFPNWKKLYEKAFPQKSEEKIAKEIKQKTKNTKNLDENLWGRTYHFTEYYDATTGLIIRFKRIRYASGLQNIFPVDEFEDFGPFFIEDLGNPNTVPLTINELGIRYDNKYHEDWQEEYYLSKFPINSIFNFLYDLGIQFPNCERNTIIKWPDKIEEAFKKMDIKYTFQPAPWIEKIEQLEIEEIDKSFFQKWGNPKVAETFDEEESSCLKNDDGTSFNVDLKIFRKGENGRISNEA